MTWNEFFSNVKERINPLVTEDILRNVTNALMDAGEVGVKGLIITSYLLFIQ